MNVRLEGSRRSSPKIETEVPRPPIEVPINHEEAACAPLPIEVVADDSAALMDAKKVRLELEGEQNPDVARVCFYTDHSWTWRFTERLEGFAEAIEAGSYPSVKDLLLVYELRDAPDAQTLAGQEQTRVLGEVADRHLRALVDRLRGMRSLGESEDAVLSALLKKFYVETTYDYHVSSVAQGFGELRGMNCDARFKGIVIVLEELGYDPQTEIYFCEFADHAKVLLKRGETFLQLDGGVRPIPYEPENGTAIMPLNDYKRILVGLEPHEISFPGSSRLRTTHQEHPKGFFSRIFEIFQRQKTDGEQAWGASRRADYAERLKSSDPLDLSRYAYLVPPVLQRLNAYALSSVFGHALTGRTGRAVNAGVLAVALYSACGPIVEKVADAKSPEEASGSIHKDIQEMQAVLEEKLADAKNALAETLKKIADPRAKGEKPALTVVGGNAHEASMLAVQVAPQMPGEAAQMEKVAFYRMLARQERTFTIADYILQRDTVNNVPKQEFTLDVGPEARIVSGDFWRYMIGEMREEKERQNMQTVVGAHNPDRMRELDPMFQATHRVLLQGKKLDTVEVMNTLADVTVEDLTTLDDGIRLEVVVNGEMGGSWYIRGGVLRMNISDEIVEEGRRRWIETGFYTSRAARDRGREEITIIATRIAKSMGDDIVID